MKRTKAGTAIRKTAPLKTRYEDAPRMYFEGLSIQEVANFYGVTRQAMWDLLKRRGVTMRPKPSGTANHFHRGTKADDRAQNTLEKAIQKGLIQRKARCESCGQSPTFKDGRSGVQAHHPDYNKPLDVMWLCQKCHHDWHKKNRAIPRERR